MKLWKSHIFINLEGCLIFFNFIFYLYQNLAKFYGWLPFNLHHNIGHQKHTSFSFYDLEDVNNFIDVYFFFLWFKGVGNNLLRAIALANNNYHANY
jgi:hypothetical protein